MRGVDVAAGAVALALIGSLCSAPPAYASTFGVELNGTYRVLSDGGKAKGNEVFFDQQTVVQTWTVSTTCVNPLECSGEVRSDKGWTAPIRLNEYWIVDHDIADWVPCPNGTFAPGRQKFFVYGWNPERLEVNDKNPDFLVGRDITKSPSGACGRNQPIVIDMPVRMQKVS